MRYIGKPEADGDITGVTAGTNLSGGGTSGNVTINLDGVLPVANGGTGLTGISTLLNSNTTKSDVGLGNVENKSSATIRSEIVAGDIPTLNQNTTGTAAGLSATLAVSSGGTGATTLASNSILTGNGTSAIQAEAGLTYNSETLTIGDDDDGAAAISRLAHSDDGGGKLCLYAGNGGGTDKAGGSLCLYAGASTGSTYGGDILFYSNGRGASGSSLNTSEVYMTMGGMMQTLTLNKISTLAGPTDLDFTIKSDGNMTFKIDADNDEASQVFKWQNGGADIVKLHESGNLELLGHLKVGGFTGGSGIEAINSSGQVALAAQPNITTMTGVFSGSANQLVTDDGDGTVTSESSLTYNSEILNIGNNDDGVAEIRRLAHSDDDGGALYIRGGDATAGQTDKAGGDVIIFGGRSTSNAAGGSIVIKSNKASGGSGAALQSSSTIASFRGTDGKTLLTGNLIFEGPVVDGNDTEFVITEQTANRTITVPDEDVDLAEVNHHYDYLHLNCQMTANSLNQYMGYGGHYNFNIGAVAYSDGGSVANKNTTKWSHYQAITAATIHTVYYNFTSTGGASRNFVFELWEIIPGSGSANNTTNLIKQYSITGNASDSFVTTATDTTGYTLAAGAGLLPVIRKIAYDPGDGSGAASWAGNIFGEMTIKFKY